MRITADMDMVEIKKTNYIQKQGFDEQGQPRMYTLPKVQKYIKKTGPRKPLVFTESTLQKSETRKTLDKTVKGIRKTLGTQVTSGKINDDDLALLHEFITDYSPVKLREYLGLRLSSKL